MGEYHKKYYQDNIEKFKQRAVNWRNKHKDKFLAYQRIKQKEYDVKFPLKKRLKNIKQRCNYLRDKKYKYYGGKGIKCLLSMEDLQFLWNRDKAKLMKAPSIDRIDNDKNYYIDNCRFIEMDINRRNKNQGERRPRR